MIKKFILLLSFIAVFIAGFMVGIYTLPILTATPAPAITTLQQHANRALFKGEFKTVLKGSDSLHYDDGMVYLSNDAISMQGKLAPGPDYQLYLSHQFIDNENDFLSYKGTMQRIAEVRSFNGFKIRVPQGVNISEYNTVIIWCESFNEFITAARYQ
ncbi:DM13 domain-containing protein [Pseudoalteromonas sp. MB41]|uniref:DM13 domain-containing protein n=1 Tax=Pseudoalteromonas sp. MB41 TaxID=2896366 RepID=UPI001E333CC4|nr:DM13 domain-containing protein [Pseudoalteromonas sp. MB41]MCC9662049.1 DM13 domain-containing protein [Pseudoalteromonas sp. MB41]